MPIQFLGFSITKKQVPPELPSVAPAPDDDGAVVVASGGTFGTFVDMDGSVRTDAELVTKYRGMSMYPECDMAIDDVVNEMIVSEPIEKTVSLNLDDMPVQENVKKIITQEFDVILELLDFKQRAYELARKWYVDAHLYYNVLIDDKMPQAGIQELRYMDPRKIRKVKEVKTVRIPGTIINQQVTTAEYWLYNDKGYNTKAPVGQPMDTNATGVRIAKDSVIHTPSGLTDVNGATVLGYLHKAIKPLNQLSSMEDSLVIYRLARAPERRAFYVDVGNLPKLKAEQYLKDMMTKFKNRIVYDSSTGEIRDDRKFQTMLEDYWLPRRGDGKATEIQTLPSGGHLNDIADIQYFQKKLYQSLNVPISRLDPETGFSLGRASEISRDEVKFSKFINRLRLRFSSLFLQCLEKQLVLKRVLTLDEWVQLKNYVKFDFAKDNYFDELKDLEILNNRVNATNGLMPFAGRFVSNIWIRKHVLQQNEEEIEQMDEEIAAEMAMPQYQIPMEGEGMPIPSPAAPPKKK